MPTEQTDINWDLSVPGETFDLPSGPRYCSLLTEQIDLSSSIAFSSFADFDPLY